MRATNSVIDENIWKRTRAAILPALAAAVMAAMASGSPANAQACECKSTYDRIVESGVFKAGIRYDYPPVGYLDTNGKAAGFGPDLATEFAKRLNVKVDLIENTSRTRIPLLLNGTIDAEIGPTSPTVEREKVVDFTIPYMWDSGAVLVRKGDSIEPADYGAPKKVGVTQGSFFVDLYKAVRPDANFTTFQEYTDAATALVQRRVDAVLINRSNALSFAKSLPNIEVGKSFVQLPLGITLRQNDSKWRNWMNWTLQRMWKDGTYQALYRKNFGEDPPFYMWSPSQLQPGL